MAAQVVYECLERSRTLCLKEYLKPVFEHRGLLYTVRPHFPATRSDAGGKPCIRGTRVTVGMLVGQIGAGHTIESILADYPYIELEDIMQALRYAAWLAEKREIQLANA